MGFGPTTIAFTAEFSQRDALNGLYTHTLSNEINIYSYFFGIVFCCDYFSLANRSLLYFVLKWLGALSCSAN